MNKKVRSNLLLVSAIIAGGFLVRTLLLKRVDTFNAQEAKKSYIDNNPWLMHTAAMDAYQYYQVSSSNTRLVYGVGNEVDLVSSGMMQNAIERMHNEIISEVQQMYQGDTNHNYGSYFGSGGSNDSDNSPYWQEINRAIDSNG